MKNQRKKRKRPASGTKKVPPPPKKSRLDPAVKKGMLVLLSAVLCISFLIAQRNRIWLKAKIFIYYQDFPEDWKNFDLETQLKDRHGSTYQVAKFLENNVPAGSYLLLPPQAYIIDKVYDENAPANISDSFNGLALTSILSYHTQNYKLVHMASPDSIMAKIDYALLVDEQRRFISVKITDPNHLDRIQKELDKYTKYPNKNMNASQISAFLKEMHSED